MKRFQAALAVLGFAAGPFLMLGFLNSGSPLGVFCGLGVTALYTITFVCFVVILEERLR
jgi:hypothetical protein